MARRFRDVDALRLVLDVGGTPVGAVWINERVVSPHLAFIDRDVLSARQAALQCRVVPTSAYYGQTLLDEFADQDAMSLRSALDELGGRRISYQGGRQPLAGREVERRRCPTPDKVKYRDSAAAALALSRAGRNGHRELKSPRRSYRCPCGRWHLTSKK